MAGRSGGWVDSDTLVVPFIFVPDGAPRPDAWLAAHPDAIRVRATLVRRQKPSAPALPPAAPAGHMAPVGPRAPAKPSPARPLPFPPELGQPHKDPVAVFLRVNEVFDDPGKVLRGLLPEPAGMADARERAFLRMLRWAENGPAPDEVAYRARIGGEDPMTDEDMLHYVPKEEHLRHRDGTMSTNVYTAAGAYQVTKRTWLDAVQRLGVTDFTPASQDLIARWLIEWHNALGDVRSGNLDQALAKLKNVWSSLPGGSQSHHPIDEFRTRFQEFLNEELLKGRHS